MDNLSKTTSDIKEAAKESVENMITNENVTDHTNKRDTYNSPDHDDNRLSDQENKELNEEEDNDDFLNNGENDYDMDEIDEIDEIDIDEQSDNDTNDDETPQNNEHFLNSADPNDPIGDGSNRNENY
ncbi:hypothetical protein [Flavobacterium sp. GP15]|uniref:hypothetical protein n=1 Tax=Flavobacterium sp. GP15 TaxID=2758567 RepID=UPI00165D96D7|nr:hypothetical protein [Flavobacterium sp. GP15]